MGFQVAFELHTDLITDRFILSEGILKYPCIDTDITLRLLGTCGHIITIKRSNQATLVHLHDIMKQNIPHYGEQIIPFFNFVVVFYLVIL